MVRATHILPRVTSHMRPQRGVQYAAWPPMATGHGNPHKNMKNAHTPKLLGAVGGRGYAACQPQEIIPGLTGESHFAIPFPY